MAETGFVPKDHGFKFSNNFTNQIIGGLTTGGRCGGMVYAALDYFHYGTPIPPTTEVPPDGTALADYIMNRLRDSLVVEGPGFATLMAHPRRDGGFKAGVDRKRELGRLMKAIDQKRSVPLGLFHADHRAGYHHSVLAIGYKEVGDDVTIQVYDPNHPGVVSELIPNGEVFTQANEDHAWRAYFVNPLYLKRKPPLTAWRKVAFRTINGHYLQAENAGGSGVCARPNARGAWETFELIERTDSKFALQTHDKWFVRAEGADSGGVLADRREVGAWESFSLFGGSRVQIKAWNGRLLSALGGGGGEVRANAFLPGPWETFEMEIVR